MNKQAAEQLAQEEIKKRDGVLNHTARGKLVDDISRRMHLINSAIIWELKCGLDEAEFARSKALTEPMDEVQSHLIKASERFNITFHPDQECFANLAKVAKEIYEEEK